MIKIHLFIKNRDWSYSHFRYFAWGGRSGINLVNTFSQIHVVPKHIQIPKLTNIEVSIRIRPSTRARNDSPNISQTCFINVYMFQIILWRDGYRNPQIIQLYQYSLIFPPGDGLFNGAAELRVAQLVELHSAKCDQPVKSTRLVPSSIQVSRGQPLKGK